MKKNPEYYKGKLTDERTVLIEELKGLGVVKNAKRPDDWEATTPDVDAQESDSNEVGDKIESYETNVAIVEKLEKRLEDVDAALEKIENFTFGTCEACNEEIEEDRLEANPAARTCKAHMNS